MTTQERLLSYFADDSGNAVTYRGGMVYFKKYSDKLGCWVVREFSHKKWREFRIKAASPAGRKRMFEKTKKANGVRYEQKA